MLSLPYYSFITPPFPGGSLTLFPPFFFSGTVFSYGILIDFYILQDFAKSIVNEYGCTSFRARAFPFMDKLKYQFDCFSGFLICH